MAHDPVFLERREISELLSQICCQYRTVLWFLWQQPLALLHGWVSFTSWLAHHRQEYHGPQARYWSSGGRRRVLLENEISSSMKMVSRGSRKPDTAPQTISDPGNLRLGLKQLGFWASLGSSAPMLTLVHEWPDTRKCDSCSSCPGWDCLYGAHGIMNSWEEINC